MVSTHLYIFLCVLNLVPPPRFELGRLSAKVFKTSLSTCSNKRAQCLRAATDYAIPPYSVVIIPLGYNHIMVCFSFLRFFSHQSFSNSIIKYFNFGTPEEIRTPNQDILSIFALPVSIQGHKIWCERRDSNSHPIGYGLVPKTSVCFHFTTFAYLVALQRFEL